MILWIVRIHTMHIFKNCAYNCYRWAVRCYNTQYNVAMCARLYTQHVQLLLWKFGWHDAQRVTKYKSQRQQDGLDGCMFCTQSAYNWYCGYLDNTYPYNARLYRWHVQVLQRAVRCYNALQCPARRYNARYNITTRSTICSDTRYDVTTRGTMLQCPMLQCPIRAVGCYNMVRCYNVWYDVTMHDTMFQRTKFWGLARSQRAFGKVRHVWIDLRFMARICTLCDEWKCVWTIAFGWGCPVSGILI